MCRARSGACPTTMADLALKPTPTLAAVVPLFAATVSQFWVEFSTRMPRVWSWCPLFLSASALIQSANQSDTGLMSVMTVEEIRNICGELGVLSYTDVAQAFGKVPVDVQKMRKMNSRSSIVFHYYPCTDI